MGSMAGGALKFPVFSPGNTPAVGTPFRRPHVCAVVGFNRIGVQRSVLIRFMAAMTCFFRRALQQHTITGRLRLENKTERHNKHHNKK